MTDDLRAAALESKAWPFEEARKLLARYPDGKPGGEPVLFETGYGPSGLPHIGTFNEVLRTTMVRHAYEALTGAPTRLIAFSDDMDGLRKVPGNVPNPELLEANLGKPLTKVPDPFGKFDSFAAHNNAMLRAFLDRYGFEYEFASSTDYYTSGRFDPTLRSVLRNHQAILDIMLPTLGAERRATYSPVLPISPKSGIVLQVPVEVIDVDTGLVAFDDDGERITQTVFGGHAKLQWKVDWAMRWVALGVDYEMAGKDLIDSVTQSGRITRALGGRPPEGFNYEMFLDQKGEKISKTKGNGLSLEEWLTYGPEESLAYFAYREPKRAKQLHLGVIPRAIDDYWKSVADYPSQTLAQQLGNPVHHIHNGDVPTRVPPISFQLLLNLVSVMAGAIDEGGLYQLLQRTDLGATHEHYPELARLLPYALAHYHDVVQPTLQWRKPTPTESEALRHLNAELDDLEGGWHADKLQDIVYGVGKTHYGQAGLRDWFRALYETLLGSSQGPRMGSFIALYGIGNTQKLIAEALARAEAPTG